jgi:hypothetical protein
MNSDKNMRDEIKRVAYGLYEKRGYVPGKDLFDWLEAEKIVMQKYSLGLTAVVKSVKPTQPWKAIESAISRSRELFSRTSARKIPFSTGSCRVEHYESRQH